MRAPLLPAPPVAAAYGANTLQHSNAKCQDGTRDTVSRVRPGRTGSGGALVNWRVARTGKCRSLRQGLQVIAGLALFECTLEPKRVERTGPAFELGSMGRELLQLVQPL